MTRARAPLTDHRARRRADRWPTVIFGAFLLPCATVIADVGTLDQGIAAYRAGDYPRAFAILDDLALDGNAEALARAGRMYELGQGTPRDLPQALC